VLVNDIGCLPPKDREFIVATERRIIRATERLLQSLFPQLLEHPLCCSRSPCCISA
jgi:hypothetical protein